MNRVESERIRSGQVRSDLEHQTDADTQAARRPTWSGREAHLAGARELLEFGLERDARLIKLRAQRLLLRAVLFDQLLRARAYGSKPSSYCEQRQ